MRASEKIEMVELKKVADAEKKSEVQMPLIHH